MVKHKLAYALSAIAVTLGAGVLTPAVFADGEAYDLEGCIKGTEETCTLTSDVEINGLIKITSDKTIDLNGHNITSATTAKFFEVKGRKLEIKGSGEISTTDTTNTGIIRVYGTDSKESTDDTLVIVHSGVKMNGPNPIVIYANKGAAYNTEVNVMGELVGQNSGIWLIGNVADKENIPHIYIYSATIKAEGAEDSVAVSAMGYADWTIDSAVITGTGSGVGIKGGIVKINNSKITGTGDPVVLPPLTYNNGINASGAAIQIEENAGYPGGIELNVSNSTLKSEHKSAIYRYGDVEGAVKSVNIAEDTKYQDNIETEDGKSWIEFDGPSKYDFQKEMVIEDVPISTLSLSDEGGALVLARDIVLTDEDGNPIEIKKEDGVKLTVRFAITADEYAALKEYNKIQMVYFDGGKEVERIDAELKGDDIEGYYVEFITSHLSIYGVVGVNNDAPAGAPDSGTMTAAGASAANAAIVTAIAVGLLTSIVSFAYLIRRR